MARSVKTRSVRLFSMDPRKPVSQLQKYRPSLMSNLCLVTSRGYGGLYELSSATRRTTVLVLKKILQNFSLRGTETDKATQRCRLTHAKFSGKEKRETLLVYRTVC
jgi:hypothetical protein